MSFNRAARTSEVVPRGPQVRASLLRAECGLWALGSGPGLPLLRRLRMQTMILPKLASPTLGERGKELLMQLKC